MLHQKERKSPSTCLLPLHFLQMVSTIYHLKIHTVNYPRPTGIVPHCSKSTTNQNQTPNKTLSFQEVELSLYQNVFNARNQDISLACRLLDSKSLYTATNLNSNRLIENVYYGSKSTKLVCVHCGAADIRSAEYKSMLKQYKNVFPVCQHCFNKGKKKYVIVWQNNSSIVQTKEILASLLRE